MATDLGQYFPATIELALFAIVISIVVGVGLGVFAAVRRGHPSTAASGCSASSASRCRPSGWRSLPSISSSTASAGSLREEG